MDIVELYRAMSRARAFDAATADLWARGLISGEMHLGTGEEAVLAGTLAHLREGDALALDHRPSAALVLRGVDMVAILAELLGRETGLCRGRGGHMHLFSEAHLAASSGIVGASAPMGAGFALAARQLRPRSVAFAFLGDGAMNQGSVLETLNLAVAWELPLVLVCKHNGWAITTRSAAVTGGDLVERVAAFGWRAAKVDGLDVVAMHEAAGRAVLGVRKGRGPHFLQATCSRLDGHLLGDLTRRVGEHPVREGADILRRTARAALRPGGAGLGARAGGMLELMKVISAARGIRREGAEDPLPLARARLREQGREPEPIDEAAAQEVASAVAAALQGSEVA